MSEIQPYRLDVPEAVLEDLRARLDRARLPDQIPGTEWDYGTDAVYLKELCAYWRDHFDWRAVEKRLNATPQFTTEIDGQSIYFQHVESPVPEAFPLLLSHGWPGSVLEFEKIAPLLLDPAAQRTTPVTRCPLMCGWIPRRVVSTSGNSGMVSLRH